MLKKNERWAKFLGFLRIPKIKNIAMLVKCQMFGDLCFFGRSGSILQIRTNLIKIGSKSWLLTCSTNFEPTYLSLLYLCLRITGQSNPFRSNFLPCLGLPTNSHLRNSISCIFLQSCHQVGMNNYNT